MKLKISVAMIAATTMLTFSAHAADAKKGAAAEEPKDLVSSFRCEKLSGSLGDVKLKMIEACNLDKPFSSSMTRTVGGEEIYMYCCHKAK